MVNTYVVEADVPFLCGKNMLEKWEAKLDTNKRVLETRLGRDYVKFKMINTKAITMCLK